jgi:phosphoglycerate dehydrogenase-like enzyme
VVDQAALAACLREERIAGAGLDVLDQEPPDEDDPILKLDNVVLSAHALNWTDNLNAKLAETNIRAILDLVRQRNPAGVVNQEVLGSAAWHEKRACLGALSACS